MAFGLAVYASPDRLPDHDEKLASSRWSDATGRALHPQGPNRRFQSACIISSSFSKLAWRNRLVLRAFRLDAKLRRSVGPKRAGDFSVNAYVDQPDARKSLTVLSSRAKIQVYVTSNLSRNNKCVLNSFFLETDDIGKARPR